MQRHTTGMPHQKQHHSVDQIADVTAISIAGERAGACAGLAVRHNCDPSLANSKPVTFDIMPVREFLIYTVRGKLNSDRFDVTERVVIPPIRVQCKRNIKGALVIGAESDTNSEKKNIAVNLALIAWHASPVCYCVFIPNQTHL
jgi:hypothetical protein